MNDRVPDPNVLMRHVTHKAKMQRTLGDLEVSDTAILVVKQGGRLLIYGCGAEADSATAAMGLLAWGQNEVYASLLKVWEQNNDGDDDGA
jgi:hypothetical protein